jgi:hypothetical protein
MIRYVLAALAIAALVCQMMAGDLKITYKSEVKAMLMTQKGEVVHYYSARYLRTTNEKEEKDTLIDYKDFVTYEINHKKKMIYIFTLDDMLKVAEAMNDKMKNTSPENKKKVESLFGVSSDDVAKTEQLGTETVAGRTCNKWKITIGKNNLWEASVDPTLELPIPKADLDKGNKLQDTTLVLLAGMSSALSKLQDERTKIKGYPLKIDSYMKIGLFTIRTKREAVKIEERPISASVFDLPKDYKTEDAGKKMLENLEKEMNEKPNEKAKK